MSWPDLQQVPETMLDVWEAFLAGESHGQRLKMDADRGTVKSG